MLTDEEEYTGQAKKRRLHRACNPCRRRKSRCDGSRLTGEKCSACIEAELVCTYAVDRVPSSTYVQGLEARLEISEALVRELRAELASLKAKDAEDGETQTNGASSSNNAKAVENGNAGDHSRDAGEIDGHTALLALTRIALRNLGTPAPPPPQEDDVFEILCKLGKITISDTPGPDFLGHSSDANLIKATIKLKGGARALPVPPVKDHRTHSKQEQRWTVEPWENPTPRTHAYSFPTPDLAAHLIQLYFTRVNVFLPLLHRPTFERAVEARLHLRDDKFAATLLLVCAIGAQWSDRASTEEPGWGTRGWTWFNQVPPTGTQLLGRATLYDLQYYCLAVQFLDGAYKPPACWMLLGVGVRLAMDVGAHRRMLEVSVEGELWKRAFWVLIFLDRHISRRLGRCCAVQQENFDIELPTECDDEYWEHPTRPFKQPVGEPSRIAFFNAMLRLSNVLEFSLRSLYPLGKPRLLFELKDTWDEQVVAVLDTALQRWHDEVPAHILWDPARADPVFFDQSVTLHCQYLHLRMLIHRPLIPMMRTAPTALSSLTICINAARTCGTMVDVHRQRTGRVMTPLNLDSMFTSAMILLLNLWSAKRAGLLTDTSADILSVYKCMESLRACDIRWHFAGTLLDILHDLSSVGQIALPKPSSPRTVIQLSEYDRRQPVARTQTVDSGLPLHVVPPIGGSSIGPLAQETFPPQLQLVSFAVTTPADAMSFAPDASGWDGDPAQASRELDDLMNILDTDVMAMWNAPTGVEVEDWGTYFSGFSHGQPAMNRFGDA